jgi:hypothetical protein
MERFPRPLHPRRVPYVDVNDGYIYNEAERQQLSLGRQILKVWGTTRNPTPDEELHLGVPS